MAEPTNTPYRKQAWDAIERFQRSAMGNPMLAGTALKQAANIRRYIKQLERKLKAMKGPK